jgi:hypothetical protein
MSLGKHSIYKGARVALAGAGFLSQVAPGVAAAAEPPPPDRSVRGEATSPTRADGAEARFGSDVQGCDDDLEVSLPRLGPEDSLELTLAIDDDCGIREVRNRRDRSAFDSRPTPGVRVEAPQRGVESELAVSAQSVLYGNWIYSSQTLMDAVWIDVGKFQWFNDRVWDGSMTRFKGFGEYYGSASTSKHWNHPNYAAVTRQDTSAGTQAVSTAYGRFHSDWLWCNLQPGQNWTMTTTLTSYKDGGYDVRRTQSRTCSGTYMSTSSSTSTQRPSCQPLTARAYEIGSCQH